MTHNEETGRYEMVYTGVDASITGYAYKITVDGAKWIPDGMGNDPVVYVDDDNATVTIWYDEITGEWGAEVEYAPTETETETETQTETETETETQTETETETVT